MLEGLTMADRFGNLALNFIFIAFYTISGILLIKKSKSIAEKIAHNAKFESPINLQIKNTDVLFVTLIALGLYILITRFPKLVLKIYSHYKQQKESMNFENANYTLPGENTFEVLLTTLMAIVLIVYAKTFTEYLSKKIEHNELDELSKKDLIS